MKKLMLAVAAATGLLSLSALALGSATTAAAQDGSEFLVNVATDGDQLAPAITRLSDGGFTVAWESDVPSWPSSTSDVFGRRYSAAIAPVSREFGIPKRKTFSQASPAVGALTDGGFVAAWETNAHSGGSSFEIHAQRYGSDGAKVGGEFKVTTADTGSLRVAGLDDGGFVIAWITEDDGVHQTVYAARYDVNGARIGRPLRVWSGPISFVDRAVPATVDVATISGGFVVVWDAQPSGSHLTVYARIYATTANSTTTVRKLIQVNTITSSHQYFPHVAALSGGDFVVAWTGDPAFLGSGVRAQVFSATGKREKREFSANTSDGPSLLSAIAPLSSGGFVIVYHTTISNSSDIAGQRFGPDGSKSGTEFVANSTSAGLLPSVEGLDGGFVVIWQSQDDSGSGIYARYLSN